MELFVLVYFLCLLFPFSASQPSSIPGHLAYIDWNIPNVPRSGLADITFPMSIANATHDEGWYFAQQYKFIGSPDVGYIGLQPRRDVDSDPRIHAVFSSFVNGTTSEDVNCHDGADSGPGVSCAVDISGSYSNVYHLRVQNTRGTTWDGTLIDTVTGTETHIGSYTLPASTLGIMGSDGGFVEWWPFNNGSPVRCDSLSQTSVVFGAPITSTEGAGPGILKNAHEVYDCAGKQNFETRNVTGGVEITVGSRKLLSPKIFSIPWSIPGAPSRGFYDISFPVKVDDIYETSHHFVFLNTSNKGSISLYSGGRYMQAGLIVRLSGTTINAANCFPYEPDGVIICNKRIYGEGSDAYIFRVYNVGRTTWNSSVINLTSGKETQIGSIILPVGSGGLNSSGEASIELIQKDNLSFDCGSLIPTTITLGNPFTSSIDEVSGGIEIQVGLANNITQ